MSKSLRVAVLVGSLRRESFSRKIARALTERAPEQLECELLEIGNLPLYNEDLEQAVPPEWQTFRNALGKSDAVLFVTPEYNRSLPGCLKNALDVGSRPAKHNLFDGVPAGVVSVTPYKLGAFGANHALRQTFVFLNMPALQQPEVYVSRVEELLDESGKLKNPETDELLRKFMTAFADWIEKVKAPASRDFEAFMRQRHEAASAYVRGDATPLAGLVTRAEPATFFSPKGDALQGAGAVLSRYEIDAKTMKGGATRLEVLQSAAGGGLAFWTGLQHAEMKDGDRTVPMTLRVTEVFRVEDGALKLVHRHADAAK